MIKVQDVYNTIDTLAPFSLAESWDNVGLLVGSGSMEVNCALLALDVTSAVVEEAIQKEAGLIVTHHPVIFRPVARIGNDSVVWKLIQAGIAVISAHTNLDISRGGVNDALARKLGLTSVRDLDVVSTKPFYKVSVFVPSTHGEAVYFAMAGAGAGSIGNYNGCGFFTKGEGRFLPVEGANPAIGHVGQLETVEEMRIEMIVSPEQLSSVVAAMKEAHPYEEVAYDIFKDHGVLRRESLGRVGDLDKPVSADEFARNVKLALGVGGLKYVDGRRPIQTAAVLGGSGGDYISQARKAGAQALVTGECKHNHLNEAREMGMTLIEGGHFSTETVVLPSLLKQLKAALPELSIEIAMSNADPVSYL